MYFNVDVTSDDEGHLAQVESLWQGKPRVEIVRVSEFSNDFQVILGDVFVYDGRAECPECVEVKVSLLEEFDTSTASRPAWEPDWCRYTYEACMCMIEAGVIPRACLAKYDSPETWGRIRIAGKESEAYESGLMRYLENIKKAMLSGVCLPPVILANGALVDGFHRTNAAVMGGSRVVPFIDIVAAKG